MSESCPDKMKVAELRSALQDRGLDTKGTKPVLVARLQEALDAEKPEEPVKTEEEAEAAANGDAAEPMDEDKKEEVKAEEGAEEPKKEEDKTEEKKAEEGKGVKRKADAEEPYEVKEHEPEIDESVVCLDWYNSDLNLRINDDLTTAAPFSREGWGYCYAGARATHGVKTGKVWYEVKFVEQNETKVEKDKTTYDLRVGWSTDNSSLMLGESETSWAYSSAQGKMVNSTKFEEYGEKFVKGDVIGAFLDFGEEEVGMTFTKNGEDQGDAFQIKREDFPADAFIFPHILSRNVKFQVNFGVDAKGEDMADWKEKLEGEYVKIAKAEEKGRGVPRIATRAECEMIMMVGLPGSGKTTWVEKHVAENPDKHYNIISTNDMFKRMTVNGEPRKKVHKGKWELVIQKATRSLQEIIKTASTKRRNIIIDQTNVFANAQKRKSRPFTGFMARRCVVVVPTDEEYKARVKNQEEAGCKDIPDEAIMEMKANFKLPEENDENPSFSEISFIELDREEGQKVVDLYNKVAKEKGYGKKHQDQSFKKQRVMRGRGNFRAQRGGWAPRGAPFMRGGRGGPMPFRGGRGMRGGPMPFQQRGNMRGGMGGPSPWAKGNSFNDNRGMNRMGGMGMGNMGGGMGMGMGNMGGMGMSSMGGMGGMGMSSMGGGMNGMGMGGMNGMGGMGMNNMGGGMGMSGMNGMGMSSMGGGMGGMGGGMSSMGGMGGMGMNRMGGGGGGGMNSYNRNQGGGGYNKFAGGNQSRGFTRGGSRGNFRAKRY